MNTQNKNHHVKKADGFPSEIVANCFLQRDFKNQKASITPMKLQKLIYFLQGWHLAITGRSAIDGEFEAWPYGPVNPDLYHRFKEDRNNPISKYARSLSGGESQTLIVDPDAQREFQEIFEFVVERYTRYSGVQLSAMTHVSGTPWDIARNKGEDVIPKDKIKEYFIKLAQKK